MYLASSHRTCCILCKLSHELHVLASILMCSYSSACETNMIHHLHNIKVIRYRLDRLLAVHQIGVVSVHLGLHLDGLSHMK